MNQDNSMLLLSEQHIIVLVIVGSDEVIFISVASPVDIMPVCMITSATKEIGYKNDYNYTNGNKWQREMLETVYSFR